jgi:hypothetical protein
MGAGSETNPAICIPTGVFENIKIGMEGNISDFNTKIKIIFKNVFLRP